MNTKTLGNAQHECGHSNAVVKVINKNLVWSQTHFINVFKPTFLFYTFLFSLNWLKRGGDIRSVDKIISRGHSLHRGQWRRLCSPVPQVVPHGQCRVASSWCNTLLVLGEVLSSAPPQVCRAGREEKMYMILYSAFQVSIHPFTHWRQWLPNTLRWPPLDHLSYSQTSDIVSISIWGSLNKTVAHQSSRHSKHLEILTRAEKISVG